MNISWATPIYLLGLYGLTRYFIGKQEKKTGIGWTSLESVAVTVCIYFVGQLLGGLIIYSVLYSLGWDEARVSSWLQDNAVGQFLIILLIESISVAALVRFLELRQSSLKTIGLKGWPKLSDFGYAGMAYVLYFIAYLVLLYTVKTWFPGLDLDQEQEIGFKNVAQWQLPLVFASLVILPPLVEEILVRGFLYTGLKSKLPRYAAIIITSCMFAAAHLQFGSNAPLLWVAAIDTFTLSLFLIYLRDKTGRLWSPIFLHAIKNFIAFLVLFVFTVGK